MKKWILKCLILIIPVYAAVILTNYFVDPANIFHASMVDDIVNGLKSHEAVEITGDFDEGKLLEKRIAGIEEVPSVMITGSSHVLYVAWDFDDYLNIGMSGEFLDDIYATVGLLEKYDKLPETLVIGVDPYIFMDGLSIRQDSLRGYADYQENIVAGRKAKLKEKGTSIERIKELFSFSYFQSSVSLLISGKNATYVNPTDDISTGAEMPKILKTGVRVPASVSYMSVTDMDSASDWDVSNGAIYCMVDFEELSEERVEKFEALIDHLKERGVKVELYLPAWYPNYYNEFLANEKFAGVLRAENYVRTMAARRGIIVHGSYDPELSDIVKEDFLDYFHLNPEGGLKNYNTVLDKDIRD